MAAAAFPALAQDIPIPSFIDRDGSLFGNEPSKPGAYVSPSASDLVPDAADVGATPVGKLKRYDPIALPTRPGKAKAPEIDLPGLPAYTPQNGSGAPAAGPRGVLSLEARLTNDGKPVPNGLVWRLFSAEPSTSGKLVQIASSQNGRPKFEIPAGSYILHVDFGSDAVVQRVEFAGTDKTETVDLDAGGLELDAVSGKGRKIDAKRLSFDVYAQAGGEPGSAVVARDVPAREILRLKAGTYHVVSNYGQVNALVRADIRVEAGKITKATLKHHAAFVTLKLVREHGGEAIADTAWTINTVSGDLVSEKVGAFPSMVLAAGDYIVVAKNRDKVYQRAVTVSAGGNEDVEVLTSDTAPVTPTLSLEGSGD